MGTKKSDLKNKTLDVVQGGFDHYKKNSGPQPGTKTALNVAQTSVGSRVASVAANMNGIPATPTLIKVGAAIASKALNTKKVVDNAIQDKINASRKP